ncbi:MAG: cation-translocating P-type ATPase [Thermostichus sp. DG_1_6_bins_120]
MMTPTGSPSSFESAWHSLSVADTAEKLKTDPDRGLTSQQVAQRQQQYGPNELISTSGRSRWRVLLDQFTNIMLLMLIAVAAVSGVLALEEGEFPKDALAILLIVCLNSGLGYLQESRAEKALAALKKLASPSVRVERDGLWQEISASQLVPGDRVLLEAGVQIPADGRLAEAVNLQVREAALTGEAVSVVKQADCVLPPDTELGERRNMAFMGTEVMQGRGILLVTSTGMNTELGKVAALLQSVETEPTPLQRRMNHLGNVLVFSSLALVAVVVGVGLLQAGNMAPFTSLLETSLSMAVAVVPEGLPAVITVTLAIGTQRMVRRNALIRRLPAVETLGSVTTICSDKTGTLTENKMVVTDVVTASHHYSLTGTGYIPKGSFYCAGKPIDPQECPDLLAVLRAVVFCNDALLQTKTPPATGVRNPRSAVSSSSSPTWSILGDPTEAALLVAAAKANLHKASLQAQYPRVQELPFSSERKRMSVVIQEHGSYRVYMKGSPELVLEQCDRIQNAEGWQPLSESLRQTILQTNNKMAGQGTRVLGVATLALERIPENLEAVEQNLIWLGLVGMHDAPRPEAREAVARCHQAGIRTLMITGDHQLTALAIARDLGIIDSEGRAVDGRALSRMSADELLETVRTVNVYARVAPEHKLHIVQALQKQQQFVAMTGDGVNDAPALRQADIGIAMGITGTDVSKEASDMILLDDNFATIVAAIEEGRVVYCNIRRFVKYILGSNIGEVLTVAAAPIVGLGDVPLTPLQILWMNLVTDGLPALALAMEPAEPGVMERPPFNPKESIFAQGLGAYMLRIGVFFAMTTIIMMLIVESYTPHWRTMVFTTLCIAQMGHAVAVRSNNKLIAETNPLSNPYLFWAVLATLLLQFALLYVPFLRNFFGTEALTSGELWICMGFSSLIMVWVELEKLYSRWIKGSKPLPSQPLPTP